MQTLLHGARVDGAGATTEHVATLTFAPGTLDPCEVRFSVEGPGLVSEQASVVPFVPAAVVLASRLGQDLRVDEPLPPELHAGARAVAALLARWYGWRPAELIAPLASSSARPRFLPRRGGVGLFFTRGIDSWGTFLELRDGDRRHRPTHLITVDTEVHHDPAIRQAHLARTGDVAAQLGLPLVVVGTDIRAALDPHLDWGTEVHGSVFAGIGLLLRSVLREVVISPTHWTPLLRPWGSHPELDPNWSLPDLRVVHHPGHEQRWRRVQRVAADPVAVRSIQVCWQGTSLQNCGRCEKCLRLMTSLELVGALPEAAGTFDSPFDPEAIVPGMRVSPHPWCDTIDHLDRVGLAADPLRQRWERTEPVGNPRLWFQRRPVQPRIPVERAGTAPAELDHLARRLARIGARVDHLADPSATQAALVLQPDGRVCVRTGSAVGSALAVDELEDADLRPLLAAVGADVDDLVAFDPDGQDPPPVVPQPAGWSPEPAAPATDQG